MPARSGLRQRQDDRTSSRDQTFTEIRPDLPPPRFGYGLRNVQIHSGVHAGAQPQHGGIPLEGNVRCTFESRFQQDFSGVRIHAGSTDHPAVRNANAGAATLDHDIFFAPGRYAPHHPEGRRLLAHELTHVVQQGLPGAAAPSADHEAEADSVARAFTAGGTMLRPQRASARALQFDKGYPKTVKIGNSDVSVATPAEETEANKIITDIKSIYGIDFDSAKGLQAVKDKVVGDPDQPQSIADMYENKPRRKVKDVLQTSAWTLPQLRDVKAGLSFYRPVLGMARSFSTRAGTTQELTSLSRVNTGLNDAKTATSSNVQGEYFSSANNATLYDSAGAATELADKTKAFEGTVVHEAAHALLGYGESKFVTDLNPAYWQDAKTAASNATAEKPITNYGTKNAAEDLADAAMFYFLERGTLQSKCPQRDKILDSLVKGWATPLPKP